MKKAVLFILFALGIYSSCFAGEIHTYTDKNGVHHMKETPPTNLNIVTDYLVLSESTLARDRVANVMYQDMSACGQNNVVSLTVQKEEWFPAKSDPAPVNQKAVEPSIPMLPAKGGLPDAPQLQPVAVNSAPVSASNRDPEKTVHVKGYTKKDGTIVQSHWRSAPEAKSGK